MKMDDHGFLNDTTMAKQFRKGKQVRTYCRWCESQVMYAWPFFMCPVCDTVPDITEGIIDVPAV